MRFDDSLDTVLAAGGDGPGAIEMTWRQLVDLIGRRRGTARPEALERLRAIRARVPIDVRRAAARGLERADPPAGLVALFIDEELSVAGPVVRSAQLDTDEWFALLPAMTPAARGVLRLRSDLSLEVVAALAAFGPADFALNGVQGAAAEIIAPAGPAERAPEASPEATPPGFVAPDPDPFVAVAEVARELPVVAEAMRRDAAPIDRSEPSREDFEIASLVARIEAHQRTVPEPSRAAAPQPTAPADSFRFETNAAGAIRWVEGIDRTSLIGISLTAGGNGRPASVDGVAAGALARRSAFHDARLEVGGGSESAGDWRIRAVPAFDRESGRFTGYRGTARRPRIDEAPRPAGPSRTTDMLRQLVHELRTPTNAISGFAEMIEHQLLGPVAPPYREQAVTIRDQTAALLGAIDDLDTAARIESRRLDLGTGPVPLAPVLGRVLAELEPLAEVRGAVPAIAVDPDAVVSGDAAALHRLLSRFLAAILASAAPGEPVVGRLTGAGSWVELSLNRPQRFTPFDGGLFEADAEAEAAVAGGPLLGTGFAFRLARRLATELGGVLEVEATRLTLRLPTADAGGVEQATV